jgi:ribosomal protein L31E
LRLDSTKLTAADYATILKVQSASCSSFFTIILEVKLSDFKHDITGTVAFNVNVTQTVDEIFKQSKQFDVSKAVVTIEAHVVDFNYVSSGEELKEFNVDEGTPQRTDVIRLSSILLLEDGAEIELNIVPRLKLSESNEYFVYEANTGLLRLVHKLRYSEVQNMNLVFTRNDQLSQSLSKDKIENVLIKIKVIDTNDEAPTIIKNAHETDGNIIVISLIGYEEMALKIPPENRPLFTGLLEGPLAEYDIVDNDKSNTFSVRLIPEQTSEYALKYLNVAIDKNTNKVVFKRNFNVPPSKLKDTIQITDNSTSSDSFETRVEEEPLLNKFAIGLSDGKHETIISGTFYNMFIKQVQHMLSFTPEASIFRGNLVKTASSSPIINFTPNLQLTNPFPFDLHLRLAGGRTCPDVPLFPSIMRGSRGGKSISDQDEIHFVEDEILATDSHVETNKRSSEDARKFLSFMSRDKARINPCNQTSASLFHLNVKEIPAASTDSLQFPKTILLSMRLNDARELINSQTHSLELQIGLPGASYLNELMTTMGNLRLHITVDDTPEKPVLISPHVLVDNTMRRSSNGIIRIQEGHYDKIKVIENFFYCFVLISSVH